MDGGGRKVIYSVGLHYGMVKNAKPGELTVRYGSTASGRSNATYEPPVR